MRHLGVRNLQLGLAVTLAALLVGCASSDAEMQRFYDLGDEGRGHLDEGRWHAAAESFAAQAAVAPTNPIPHYNAACAFSMAGRIDQAFASLEHSVDLGYWDATHAEQDDQLAPLHDDRRFEQLTDTMRQGLERWQEWYETAYRDLDPATAPAFRSLGELEESFDSRRRAEDRESWRHTGYEATARKYALYDEKIAALRRYVDDHPNRSDRDDAALAVLETLVAYKGSWIGDRWGGHGAVCVDAADWFLETFPDSEHRPRAEYARAMARWFSRPEIETGGGVESPLFTEQQAAAFDAELAEIARRHEGSADGGRALVRRMSLAYLRADGTISDDVRAHYDALMTTYVDDAAVQEFVGSRADEIVLAIRGLEGFEGVDLSGKTWNRSAFAGQVVLVDFWATWCGPCIQEIPALKKAYAAYHDRGFEIVGVSLDNDTETLETWIGENDVAWPQLWDGEGFESRLARRYGVRGIPQTVLLDRDGTVAAVGLRGEQLVETIGRLVDGAGS